jgi:hypothetical protein
MGLIAIDLAQADLADGDETEQHGQRRGLGAERRLRLGAAPELRIEVLQRVRRATTSTSPSGTCRR